MSKISEENIPCKNCIHSNVCSVKSCFLKTEIITAHPFIIVELKCTEFYENRLERKCEVLKSAEVKNGRL